MAKLSGNQRRVSERGGSMVVTIPAVLAAQLEIKGGSVVAFATNGRELIMQPVEKEDE